MVEPVSIGGLALTVMAIISYGLKKCLKKTGVKPEVLDALKESMAGEMREHIRDVIAEEFDAATIRLQREQSMTDISPMEP
jgi:hypothetical protein